MKRYYSSRRQSFVIYTFKVRGLNQDQRKYLRGRSRGVWIRIGKVKAQNPWQASAIARDKFKVRKGQKLNARPEWDCE